MTLAVVDASALVPLLLEEPDSALALEFWERPDISYTAPAIVLAEVPAAVGAALVGSRVDTADHAAAVLRWRRYRRQVTIRVVDGPFAVRAAGLPVRLRGMDRLYVQASVELGGVPLLSFDRRQREAASRLGLALLPAEV